MICFSSIDLIALRFVLVSALNDAPRFWEGLEDGSRKYRVRSLVSIAGELFGFLEAEREDNPETRNDPDY